MVKKIVKEEINREEVLDDATKIAFLVQGIINKNIPNNAERNGYDFPIDENALDNFEEKYEWEGKDSEYNDYDDCYTEMIGTLLGVIMSLVSAERPNQKWCYTEFPKKPQK